MCDVHINDKLSALSKLLMCPNNVCIQPNLSPSCSHYPFAKHQLPSLVFISLINIKLLSFCFFCVTMYVIGCLNCPTLG